MTKGFIQVEGTNYNKIFSYVVKYYFIRAFMAIVSHYNLDLEQMNIKTAF